MKYHVNMLLNDNEYLLSTVEADTYQDVVNLLLEDFGVFEIHNTTYTDYEALVDAYGLDAEGVPNKIKYSIQRLTA